MTFQKIIFCCLGIFGLILVAAGQQENIRFTSLSSKDGLSSNTVNAILKDRYGLMWFATDDGLNKFDGTNFTVYRHRPGNKSSLQANEILSLYEDKAGNLWISTGGGSLSVYDRKKDSFINFPTGNKPNAIGSNVVFGVCSDYLGRIWVAHYSGVDILDTATRRVSNISVHTGDSVSLSNKISSCLFEDSRRQMWIGTNEVFLSRSFC